MAKSTKEKIELAVTGVGLVILAVILVVRFSGMGDREAPASQEESPAVQAVPEDAGKAALPDEAVDTAAQAEVLERPLGRDPFSPASEDGGTVASDVSLLRLKGISIKTGSEPIAMIGNSIVRQGDTIQGVQIVEIGRDYVLVRKGSREYKLGLER